MIVVRLCHLSGHSCMVRFVLSRRNNHVPLVVWCACLLPCLFMYLLACLLVCFLLYCQVVQVVCCKLTPLQRALYEHFLLSNATRRLLSGSKATGVLSAITCLKKLCNHPKLIYDTLHSKAQVGSVQGGSCVCIWRTYVDA
jgi:hypothetical protein